MSKPAGRDGVSAKIAKIQIGVRSTERIRVCHLYVDIWRKATDLSANHPTGADTPSHNLNSFKVAWDRHVTGDDNAFTATSTHCFVCRVCGNPCVESCRETHEIPRDQSREIGDCCSQSRNIFHDYGNSANMHDSGELCEEYPGTLRTVSGNSTNSIQNSGTLRT